MRKRLSRYLRFVNVCLNLFAMSNVTLVLTDPNQPARCYPAAEPATPASIRRELRALAKGVLRGGSAVALDEAGNVVASVRR
jgi:hypothetical protein